jgi:beta-glucosidase-like glycosyl hydrolase
VTARDQVEYFLPPFESSVKRGKTQSVMCSYNAVRLAGCSMLLDRSIACT